MQQPQAVLALSTKLAVPVQESLVDLRGVIAEAVKLCTELPFLDGRQRCVLSCFVAGQCLELHSKQCGAPDQAGFLCQPSGAALASSFGSGEVDLLLYEPMKAATLSDRRCTAQRGLPAIAECVAVRFGSASLLQSGGDRGIAGQQAALRRSLGWAVPFVVLVFFH